MYRLEGHLQMFMIVHKNYGTCIIITCAVIVSALSNVFNIFRQQPAYYTVYLSIKSLF